jgi:hypothetical protein
VESLVPYILLPTLAGIHPRRRRHCLRRLPLIRHVCSQLTAPTPSPRLTEACAQVPCRHGPSEPHRQQQPLRRHLGFSSRPTLPAITALDTGCNRTVVSS